MRRLLVHLFMACSLSLSVVPASIAQSCPPAVPVQGAPVVPSPVFPSDNWWNVDIRQAPVDPGSAGFIAFIGATRKLHPDFGGEESPGSTAVYGFPYALVDSTQARKTVVFDYDDESDGNGMPFYPIPAQAISQAHWVEGGAPGNVDQRDDNDRHLLVIDCSNHGLYELYNVWYDPSQSQWHAGSGAFFDMARNDRRPEGWTSADAAGLAIFPGLVRYDEATNPALQEINHALRVTLRASDGYVFPASHRAGSTTGALPMGARLRLKAQVGGVDPSTRTNDPVARRIFRAMQKYGLIMADNGSDMYISGTFDPRWDNGSLNPAFSTLSASDFEVVQLGWKAAAAALASVSASPNPVQGGQTSIGTVTLTASAPVGGSRVALSSASAAFTVPATVTVAQGSSSSTFPITTATRDTQASGTLSATYGGVSRTTVLSVTPTLPSLSIGDAMKVEGNNGQSFMRFTIRLSHPSAQTVTYKVLTTDSTATAGSDYTALNRTQSFLPGETSSDVTAVSISGDTAKESNEHFLVSVSQPINAIIGKSRGLGTIIDDEGRIKMPSVITDMTIPLARARRVTPARVPPLRRAAFRAQVILRRLGFKPHLEP